MYKNIRGVKQINFYVSFKHTNDYDAVKNETSHSIARCCITFHLSNCQIVMNVMLIKDPSVSSCG